MHADPDHRLGRDADADVEDALEEAAPQMRRRSIVMLLLLLDDVQEDGDRGGIAGSERRDLRGHVAQHDSFDRNRGGGDRVAAEQARNGAEQGAQRRAQGIAGASVPTCASWRISCAMNASISASRPGAVQRASRRCAR